MPKIKVYKGNGAIIPVEKAKLATAFICPWTKSVFATKKSYVKHLRVLRQERIHRNIRAAIHRKIFEELINQPTFEKIIEWINTHPEFIFDSFAHNGTAYLDQYGKRIDHLRNKFWLKITYLDIRRDSIKNTHCHPRNGVPANWHDNIYSSYPGWSGHIEFQISHDNLAWSHEIFNTIGIHTGSGGGITKGRYGYQVTLFDSDWPGLESTTVVETLKDDVSMKFNYGNPVYFRKRSSYV